MNSNALASQNGKNIETTICDLLGVEHHGKEIVDTYINDKPCEIKSCQEWIQVTGSNGKRRRGRFILNEEQDKFLKENGGIYVFVVQSGGEIKRTCLRKAELVQGVVGRSCGKVWSGVMSNA